ncbi:restriction endonuclease subunit S [Phaeobacter piscinae]|uniref:restriction endonuclease subunit S n=1 Tax=Phaeobacter piscinae TaxID=1580596 RepID=UPI0006933238|nr:restriction endonuclease subunit S [Phaeobacter piscinae]UTS82225.1 hypothetical protein OL67_003329 [Phaeobacter piscinae]
MVPEGWTEQALGDWLIEYREKSTAHNQHPVLTSSRNGLIPQSEYYGENRITNRDNIGFHVIPPNYITYRSRSDDGLFFFNRNETAETGIISHFYPVFHFPSGSDQFFLSLMNYHRHRYIGYSVGTSQKVLSMTALKKMKFAIPPTTEQKKIAEILSTWDRAIEVAEAQLVCARTQKRALMQSLLTGRRRFPEFEGQEWKEVRLGDIATVDAQSLGAKTPQNFAFNYISLSNVEPGRITGTLERMSFADAPSRARRKVNTGDLLVSTVRPNLMGFARVAKEHSSCIASTGFAVVSAGNEADGSYLFHYLFSHHMKSQFHALVVGSNYPAINSADVKKLRINLPPLDEQERIGEVLDDCDSEIVRLADEITKLRTEKKALMQQLLTGKRRVSV